MSKNLHDKLMAANCRIEKMISLAGAFGDLDGDVYVCQELCDFFTDSNEDIGETFGVPSEAIESLGNEFDIYNFLDESEKWGFLIQFATPIMEHSDGDVSYSWGLCRVRWVYADSFDEAVANGLAWVDSIRALEKAESSNMSAHRG